MKRKFKRLITRVGVLAMAGTLCVALMPDLTQASALESLSHIESIKQDKIESQEPFRVLELVPAEGMGSLGYYVAGQEPTADWLQKLAVIDNNTATEGTDDRETTANAMMQKLQNAGLLGTDTNTPLTKAGEYTEYLPWEAPTDVTTQELDLVDVNGEPRKEKADVKGVFQPAEDGSFDRVVVPTWAEDDDGKPNGDYNQKVEHFVRAVGNETDVYYYVPTFDKVTPEPDAGEENQYDDYVDKAIYQLETLPAGDDGEEGGDSSGSDGTEEPAEQITYYVYRGTLGQDGFAIDTNEEYYYVTVQGRPYQTYDEAVAAAANDDATDDTTTDDGTTDDGDTSTDQTTGEGDGTETGDGTGTGGDTGEGDGTGADGTDGDETPTEPEIERVYYAVGDDFVEVEDGEQGWFNISVESYEYVGEGNGDYTFDPNGGGEDTITVYYSTVLFTGGYTNNNWLATQTLDLDDDEVAQFKIEVESYTPAQLNEMQTTDPDKFRALIDGADLIVLSAGFDLEKFADETVTDGSRLILYKSDSTANNDLNTNVANAIQKAVQPDDSYADAVPALVDGRLCTLTTSATNLKGLAEMLCKDDEGNVAAGVNGNVYCYEPGTDDRYNLVTADFIKAFAPDQYETADAPYYDVWYEIDYENFLRKQQGGTELLPTDITMANSLRYIINYAGRRVVNNRTSITVLDVEPLTQVNDGGLTEATVQSWLPDSVADRMKINIVTMSTAEFIGKIEDINEEYNLVYIGASLDNFNLSTDGWPDYNDSDMDGMLYTNIGDKITTRTVTNNTSREMLIGLLDSDYIYDERYNTWCLTKKQTSYRRSGNDITATKQAELETFAETGFPVVIAQNLLNGGQEATTMTVTASFAVSDNNLTLTATVEGAGNLTPDYTWYQKGNTKPLENKNGSITINENGSITINNPPDGAYYCEATVTIGDQDYTAISNTVTVTKGDGYAVTVGDEDANGKSYTYYEGNNATVKVTKNKRAYYLSVVDGPSDTLSVTWYKQGNGWQPNDSKISATGTYVGVFEHNGKHYCTQQVKIIRQRGNGYSVDNDSKITAAVEIGGITYSPYYPYYVVIKPSVTAEGVDFTVEGMRNGSTNDAYIGLYLYKKYNDWGYWDLDAYVESEKTFEEVSAGTYYFSVGTQKSYWWGDYYYSAEEKFDAAGQQFTVTKSDFTVTENEGGTPVLLPATKASVNEDRVDNSSILYEAMTNILNYDNVMGDGGKNATWSEAQKSTLLKYLNLSSPSIKLAKYPQEYTEDVLDDENVRKEYNSDTLTYEFTIENPTEATPETTLYTVHLYIDQNADGRHVESEELPELVITDVEGKSVAADALKADTVYTVSRTLPETYTGILPWKLEVVKNDNEGVHASEVGYAYLNPKQAQSISILQISSKSYSSKATFSLESQAQDDTTRYGALFKQLKEAGIYDIKVKTLSITKINDGWTLDASEKNFDTNNNNKLDTAEELTAYFESFDMLLLGFADVYGYDETGRGFTAAPAEAVTNFVDSGKAILFTHDTTSFVNLPGQDYKVGTGNVYERNIYSGEYYWGYYFNTIIRSVVGLDRYGISDSKFGGSVGQLILSVGGKSTVKPGRLVASNYDNGTVSEKQAQELLEAGYSIAYKPGEKRNKTVSETQGYSTYALNRFVGSGADTTDTVSQVNKGQITTYPFDVNIGQDETMGVATTHGQYYQLNMNGDDIVVWYCLSGGEYSTSYNDVVNNYYIYNRGNVTYSGAGHSDPTNADEARLFVNTMIAAYRAATVNPEVDFVSASGDPVEYLYLPMEYDDTEEDFTGTIITDASNPAEVCFRIDDPNLDPNKKITVEFYEVDEDEEERPVSGIIILNPDGTAADNTADGAGLKSGTIYTAQLPQSVLTEFGTSTDEKMTLGIRVTTIIAEQPYTGTDTIELRKLGLLTLR